MSTQIPHLPIVIEDQGGDAPGVEWLVSFNGIHPEEDECVVVADGPTAFKLVGLVEKLDRRLPTPRTRRFARIIRALLPHFAVVICGVVMVTGAVSSPAAASFGVKASAVGMAGIVILVTLLALFKPNALFGRGRRS